MIFLATLLRGISLVPAVVHGIEGLLGGNNGNTKKQAAMQFVSAALGMGDAMANQQIADGEKFSAGLGKVIDGVVDCLNASVWAKAK